LAFAFGGEADPIDYARAIADGSLLALIATLGLLQLGHETTPELAQLASVSLYLYALSATPFRGWAPRMAVLVALPALAASGAPTVALALGLVGIAVSATSDHLPARPFVAWIAMGGSDRALMLALPPLAVLASFALPTLQRSTAAAIDWFSVFFFSVCALIIWVIYMAMQTGVPRQPAANVARLMPGFATSFSFPALVIAILGTLAWLWLVKWRTGRHQHALWKS